MQRQIYFAKCDDRIKVGIALDVNKRLKQLRTGAGGHVELIAAVDGDAQIESSIHRKLKPYHIHGEWFRDCPETRQTIQLCLNNFPKASADGRRRNGINRALPEVAKLLWPFKTAEHLAAIGKTDVRTARRWLARESDMPSVIVAAVVVAITERNEQ